VIFFKASILSLSLKSYGDSISKLIAAKRAKKKVKTSFLTVGLQEIGILLSRSMILQ